MTSSKFIKNMSFIISLMVCGVAPANNNVISADESLILRIEKIHDSKKEQKVLEDAQNLMERYYKFAKYGEVEKTKNLYKRGDRSREFIDSNSQKTNRMFSPIKRYTSIKVNPPILRWGEYYFPYLELVNKDGENGMDYQFLTCGDRCYLSLFHWANREKIDKYNNDILFRSMVSFHLNDVNPDKVRVGINQTPVKVCAHPPVGDQIHPICTGLLISTDDLDDKSRGAEAVEKLNKVVKYAKKPQKKRDESINNLIDTSGGPKFYFYNSYGLEKISENSENFGRNPYFIKLSGREIVSKLRAAKRVYPIGVAVYKGYAIIAYAILSDGGDTVVQFIPYKLSEDKFAMPEESVNLGIEVTTIYQFVREAQSAFLEERKRIESMRAKGSGLE